MKTFILRDIEDGNADALITTDDNDMTVDAIESLILQAKRLSDEENGYWCGDDIEEYLSRYNISMQWVGEYDCVWY